METYTCNLTIATLLIITLTLTHSSINSGCAAARPASGATNTEFIKTSCSATSYPTLCYSSLSSHASAIQQNPKLLAHAALSVSLDTASATSVDMVKLSRAAGMSHREAGAMRDCVEELSDSVDQLRRSMAEMKEINGSNFGMMMSDVQTWVSAALTDEDTCMEGFAGKVMNGATKTAVRRRIVNVAHMTSNALALINSYAALHDDEITKKDISWWCSTTPHPDPCNYFMGRDPNRFDPKSNEDFRAMTIQAAMERAAEAQSQANKLGYRGRRNIMVHKDCNNLIENTILQLNTTLQSIQTNESFTDFDAQTWLSTALTNIEICRAGPLELNVKEFTSPILSNNVSELISNSLATNGALLRNSETTSVSEYHNTGQSGFPGWVAGGDRKLLQDLALASKANVVVSKDGSGQFGSIQEAIDYAISTRVGSGRVVVYVKRGVYKENILINRTMSKVMLVGDGVRYTVITGGRSVSSGFTTYSSATVGVDGTAFIARGITFRNTAGPKKGQAVALRSASDLSVFYACSFEGYQDTLFVHAQRQFYKSCYIYGTIDFIFGNAAVVFQNCIIYVRKPLVGQANTITAQGRGDPFQNTGISIQYCRVMAAPDLKPVIGSVKTYLGRPWQQYSRTVIMKSYIDDLVDPVGWSTWGNSDFALSTLYYGEYQNFGPRAATENRVNWTGYHVAMSPTEAARFTVTTLIAGRAWLPATGVPFIAGV
ncbi:hypothetical protein BUALT_Bualt06G0127300 [Buddleja alternifolia]|uniref:Pectinesterase n=1 Tax=Buddleja alternifolia TaxID=168488 RepID=A0AAV6XEE3_9LAMI|nr:hypothetical protein BUALT_Bualt06G0127300 [Buddleja alternifolia]